jgi:hypothetical protein
MLQLIEEGTNDLRNCINNSIQMLVNNKQQAMIGILVWQVVLIGLIYMHHMRNVISMSMMVNFIFYRRLGGFRSGAGPLDMWLQRWLGDFINGMGQMRSILQCANPSLAAALLPPIQDEHPKPSLTLRFLMEYIESKVRHEGKWIVYLSVESHTCVYSTVAQSYLVVQKKL